MFHQHHRTETSQQELELIQTEKKVTDRFTILKNGQIEIESTSKRSNDRYRIDLSLLNPVPSHKKYRARAFNETVIVQSALGLAFILPSIPAYTQGTYGLGTFLLLVGLFFAQLAIRGSIALKARSYDLFLYESRINGNVMFGIKPSLPDVDTVCAFQKELESAIATFSDQVFTPVLSEDTISSRINQLLQLQKQGLLTKEEFEAAKQRLLDGSVPDERQIGFSSHLG